MGHALASSRTALFQGFAFRSSLRYASGALTRPFPSLVQTQEFISLPAAVKNKTFAVN